MLITGALAALSGIFGALLFMLLFWALYRSIVVGAALVLLLLVFETIYVYLPGIRAGILLYPEDFIFLMLGTAATIRYLTGRRLLEIPKTWLVYGAMLFVNFAIGLPKFGTYAGVDFRQFFYFYTGSIYFMSFPVSTRSLSRVMSLSVIGALLICVVAYYRWTMMALGLDDYVWLDTSGIAGRVIASSPTVWLTIAMVVVIFAFLRGIAPKAWLVALPVLMITIVGSQQRTVWAASLVALVLSFAMARQGRGQLVATFFLLGALGVAVAYPLMTGGHLEPVTQTLQSSAAKGLSTDSGTFVGRVLFWQEHLRQYASWNPLFQMVGKPFGTGYGVWVGGREFANIPHNHYVQTLLRTGLIGLLLFVGIFGLLLWRLPKLPEEFSAYGDAIWVILCVVLIFCITYSPHFSMSIPLGLGLALMAQVYRPSSQRAKGRESGTAGRPAYLP